MNASATRTLLWCSYCCCCWSCCSISVHNDRICESPTLAPHASMIIRAHQFRRGDVGCASSPALTAATTASVHHYMYQMLGSCTRIQCAHNMCERFVWRERALHKHMRMIMIILDVLNGSPTVLVCAVCYNPNGSYEKKDAPKRSDAFAAS